MRFADQRAAARTVIEAGLPKDWKPEERQDYARRVVLRSNRFPRPEPVKGYDYSGMGKARAERRKLGLRKPRKRIRGKIPPHPIAVINQAHRLQRECAHNEETYEDNGLTYCSNCHLEQK